MLRNGARIRQGMGGRKPSLDSIHSIVTTTSAPDASAALEKRNGRKSAKKALLNYDTDEGSVSSKDGISVRPISREAVHQDSSDATFTAESYVRDRKPRDNGGDTDGYDSSEANYIEKPARFKDISLGDRGAAKGSQKETNFDILPMLPSRLNAIDLLNEEVCQSKPYCTTQYICITFPFPKPSLLF